MLAEFAVLALACAPNIHPATLSAVVQNESRGNQFAIGVNDPAKRLRQQPETLDQALKAVRALQADGVNFDAGLGQINVRNWAWLGLDANTVFDPCTNLHAAQTVLTDCYARALKTHQEQQQALRAALSCYNTGDLARGISNGYVSKILAQAGVVVPAIAAPAAGPSTGPPDKPSTNIPNPTGGTPDGFSANPTPDGFSVPPSPPPSSDQADSSA